MIELNFYNDEGDLTFTVNRVPDAQGIRPDEIIVSIPAAEKVLTDRELRFLSNFLGGY